MRGVSPELFAGSWFTSTRGAIALGGGEDRKDHGITFILQTQTSRNVKRNPRFRRPDFFQDICRYSHIKLITEVTLQSP